MSPKVRSIVVLVGLPGAGKSTVGRALAERLGWEFVDLDAAIEHLAGEPVATIFARSGEAAFRAMERDVTARLAQRKRLVVAAGGGWMANPAAVALLRDHACFIYLRVTPAAALARMGSAISYRPLLSGPDPLGSISALLAARSAAYESADVVIDVESVGVQELTERVAGTLERGGCLPFRAPVENG